VAAIAGEAMTVFSNLIFNESILSPLALAFIVGYSIDLFISRLDAGIRKLGEEQTRNLLILQNGPKKGNAHFCSISGQIGNAMAQLLRKSASSS
jgi:hypothetical protein